MIVSKDELVAKKTTTTITIIFLTNRLRAQVLVQNTNGHKLKRNNS